MNTSEDQIASIELPPEVFQGFNTRAGLVFTIYNNSVLFPIGNANENRSIRSPVIGALVAGQNPLNNLTDPVQINLTLSQLSNVRKL